jgi:DNA replication and repair protein RecF
VSLASLHIEHLRCLRDASLVLAPQLTVIQGPNGSGKTSLLESVFVAGRGRSFRTRMTERLIARGSDYLRVVAETVQPTHRIGFEYQREGSYVARLDGRDVETLAELPGAFFVEVIDPDIHRLIEGAPAERRRWLDWGVFHVEHQFLPQWLRYSRALRQRNAALKAGQDASIWDPAVAEHGEQVALLRAQWIESLRPAWERAVHELSGLEIELGYARGWSQDRTLVEALAEGRERDRERGSTLSGPHRADITLRWRGAAARDVLSRGQQKLVASALVLAQLGNLRDSQAVPPTLLLDDPAAELDSHRLEGLVELVRSLNCQLVITSLAPDLQLFGHPERVFHVEQGDVRPV